MKLTVTITFKGKEYYYTFEDNRMTMDYKITVLLSNKDSRNNYELARYHYICKLYNDSILVPDTSGIAKETAFITILLRMKNKDGISDPRDEKKWKEWKLPLHAIGCQKDVFPLDGNYFILFDHPLGL